MLFLSKNTALLLRVKVFSIVEKQEAMRNKNYLLIKSHKACKLFTQGKRIMENITESNFSSFEAQTSDELSFEELESVAGGCNGKNDSIARQVGHVVGDIVAAPVKAVGDAVGGFWEGLWD